MVIILWNTKPDNLYHKDKNLHPLQEIQINIGSNLLTQKAFQERPELGCVILFSKFLAGINPSFETEGTYDTKNGERETKAAKKNLIQDRVHKNSSHISHISGKLGLIDTYNPSLRGSVENKDN